MTSAQLQAAFALTLALGLHVGAFALRPAPAGASGSGAGGADVLSLQAAGPAFADMVAAWDAPPVTPAAPPAQAAPQADAAPALPTHPDTAPDMPAADLPAADLPAAATMAPAQPDSLPQTSSAPPPPPVPAVKPKPRPGAKAAELPAKPQPAPSDSIAAQTAAGGGGGAVAGTGGTAPAPSLSQAQTADLTASWGASVRARIEKRKRYPRAADGASGSVTVRLTISRSGALASLAIAASSGNAALDEAAINAVRAAGKFPAAPKGLTDASYSFTLPMRFSR